MSDHHTTTTAPAEVPNKLLDDTHRCVSDALNQLTANGVEPGDAVDIVEAAAAAWREGDRR